METSNAFDAFGFLVEGTLENFLEKKDGVYLRTKKAKEKFCAFDKIVKEFVRSPGNLLAFLRITNNPNVETSRPSEKDYDTSFLNALMGKKPRSLVTLLDGNAKLIHEKVVSGKCSVPLAVFMIVFAIREYIAENYPQCLKYKAGRWIQCPGKYATLKEGVNVSV